MSLLESVIGALANAKGGGSAAGNGAGLGGLGALLGGAQAGGSAGGPGSPMALLLQAAIALLANPRPSGSALGGGGGAGGLGGIGAMAGGLGGLGGLVGAALGGASASGTGSGGLGGLISQFEKAGLGPQMASWISNGPNQPVSAEQMQSALGPDQLGALAQQAGLAPGEASQQLAQLLPELINHFTPQGQAPAGGLGGVEELLGALLRR